MKDDRSTKTWYELYIKKKVRTVTEQVKPARPDGYEAKFDENKDEKKKEHNVCGARTRSYNSRHSEEVVMRLLGKGSWQKLGRRMS